MKHLRRILCGLIVVFVFILTSCSKPKQKHNEEIDMKDLGPIVHDLSTSFDGEVYFEEATFATDPNDDAYEIGYAYETGLILSERRTKFYEGENYDALEHFSLTNYCIGFHKVRRNKVTKEVDENFFANVSLTDPIQSYDLWVDYGYNSKETYPVQKITYATLNETTTQSDKTILTVEEAFEYLPFDIYLLPKKYIKYTKSTKSYLYKYNDSDWILVQDENFDIAARVDFVAIDKNGREMFFITFSTALDLAS